MTVSNTLQSRTETPADLYRNAVGSAISTLREAALAASDLGDPSASDELHELAELLRVANQDHEFVSAMKAYRRG